MTAPAEDPRGGDRDCFDVCQGHPVGDGITSGGSIQHMTDPYRPPAAGRGDTDSGGATSDRERALAVINGYGGANVDSILALLADVRTDERAARLGGGHVTPAEIVRQRSLGWPDMHPEDYCHTCGRTNPVWFADTAEWQTATDSTGDGGGILCPSCFCTLWEQKTGKTAIIWRLSIGGGRDARPAGDRAQPTEGLRVADEIENLGHAFGITAAGDSARNDLPAFELNESISNTLRDYADRIRRALGGTS